MNFQNKSFIYETAKPEDGKDILEILEQGGFKGKISLTYTRRPDAYTSLKKEAPQVEIAVCRDSKENRVVGFGVCAIRNLFINGKEEKVGYLLGLRFRGDYAKKHQVLPIGYEFIYSLLKEKGITYFFTTILEENIYAQKLLEKKRSFMPEYLPIGNYEVYSLKTGQRARKHEYKFRKAVFTDISQILSFINNYGKSQQLYPVLKEEYLTKNVFLGLSIDKFYILLDNQEIIAAGAAWDQREYKQYVVNGYGGIFKIIQPISRIFKLFGYPTLPKSNSVLNLFNLSFLGIKDNNYRILEIFLDEIAEAEKSYDLFTIGLYEKHPLREAFANRPKIVYRSKIYQVKWDEGANTKLNEKIMPFLECGML